MTSVPEYPAGGRHFFLILLISLFSLKRNFRNLKILMQKCCWPVTRKERLKSGAVDSRKDINLLLNMEAGHVFTAIIGGYFVNPTPDQAVASHNLMEKFPEYTAPNIGLPIICFLALKKRSRIWRGLS